MNVFAWDTNALRRLSPLAYGLISSPQAHAVHVIRLGEQLSPWYQLLVIGHPTMAIRYRQRLARPKVITSPFGSVHTQTRTELTLELLGFRNWLHFWITVRMGGGWPGIMRQPDVGEPVIVGYNWLERMPELVRDWQGVPPDHLTFQLWAGPNGRFLEPR